MVENRLQMCNKRQQVWDLATCMRNRGEVADGGGSGSRSAGRNVTSLEETRSEKSAQIISLFSVDL